MIRLLIAVLLAQRILAAGVGQRRLIELGEIHVHFFCAHCVDGVKFIAGFLLIDMTLVRVGGRASLCFKANGIRRFSGNRSKYTMARQAQIAASELDAALSEGEIEVLRLSLQKVIRAGGGYAAVARKTGLNRTGLYKMLSSRGNPTLCTLIALVYL